MTIKITRSKIKMAPKIKKILIILLFILLYTSAYLLGREFNPVEKEVEKIVDLTELQKIKIIEDARKDWIPLDSAWTLAKVFSHDSTIYIYKDSTIYTYKDSTIYTYAVIPIPEIPKIVEAPKPDIVFVEIPKSFLDDRLILFTGFGPTYSGHESGKQWCWSWGVQFGVGIRMFTIL